MKVLKTELSRQVLADPKATEKLRHFMVSRGKHSAPIEVRSRGGTTRLKPEVVPKAA